MSYSLEDRNGDFVNFAAAFVGRISPNFRSIDFSANGRASFQCWVVLRVENERDRREIAEAIEDFEAMRQPPYDVPFDVKSEVSVHGEHISHPSSHVLRLYCAREE